MEPYAREFFEPMPSAPGRVDLATSTLDVIDLSIVTLAAGETLEFDSADREYGVVVLTGTASIAVDGEAFDGLGGRASVFDGSPTTVYVPAGRRVELRADGGAAELALASATASGAGIEPYVIRPDDIVPGTWGAGTTERHHRLIIDGTRPSERLFLAEVTVADGNWATYPPHKHEVDSPDGDELFQEELYYYRVDPQQGIGLCALYGGRVEGDTAFVIRDRTVHKMPFGYHTVTAAPGYAVWYLAVYAGHGKAAQPSVDPDHRWYTA
jgi:5-deoxy-glucuronate isomerase